MSTDCFEKDNHIKWIWRTIVVLNLTKIFFIKGGNLSQKKFSEVVIAPRSKSKNFKLSI